MRFKKSLQQPGAGRTRAGHQHGRHTPTSPEAILLGKMANHTKQIRRECSMWALTFPYKNWGCLQKIDPLMLMVMSIK